MARRFETNYRMKDGTTPLGETFFNPVFRDLDLRIHAQEEIEKDWLAAVAELNRFGLRRIDEFLAPAVQQISDVAEIGFLTATITDDGPLSIELGETTLLVDETVRQLFRPGPFLAVQFDTDPELYAVARTLEYVRETGALAIDIVSRSPALQAASGPLSGVHLSVLPGGYDAIRLLIDEASSQRQAAQDARDAATAERQAADAAKSGAEAARDTALAHRNDAQAARNTASSEANRSKTEADRAKDQADLAAQQVALAAEQAALATSNGQAQVQLAAEQAALATSNGEAQVTLAQQQAEAAALSAVQAATSSGIPTAEPGDEEKSLVLNANLEPVWKSPNVISGLFQLKNGVSLDALTVVPVDGIVTLDFNASNVFRLVVNSDITINVTNFTGRGRSAIMMLEYDSGSVDWSDQITFPEGPPIFNDLAVVQMVATPFARTSLAAEGQELFDSPGVSTFSVPLGVTELSAVAVGGGGGGRATTSGGGGGEGGDLRWASSIPVTPGETLLVAVGEGGQGGNTATAGGETRIFRPDGTVLLSASGGGAGSASANLPGARTGTSTPIDLAAGIGGGNGGTIIPAGSTSLTGGGGGAGGYSGDGGIGGGGGDTVPGGDGQGGAGGGGGASGSGVSGRGGGGGGVGLFGEGASGLGGVGQSGNPGGFGGGGGSGGTDGAQGGGDTLGHGGLYGGGGGGADSSFGAGSYGNGGLGAARIVWGVGRQYPDPALVADVPSTQLRPRLLAFPILEA